jgi:hypothetical protein
MSAADIFTFVISVIFSVGAIYAPRATDPR